MALNVKYAATLKNAQQDAITTACGASALLDIMAGAQPANPDTAVTNTTLNGSLTNVATSVVITSGASLPGTAYTAWIEAEQVTVTAGFGTTTLTVTRGVNGTTAVSHLTAVAFTPNPILATLTCNATFAPASSAGVLTLNSITSATAGTVAGTGSTASWFRLKTSGATPKIDGTVGVSGCDLNLNNVSIASGQTVAVSSFTDTNAN